MLVRSWPTALLYAVLPLLVAGFTRQAFEVATAMSGTGSAAGASQAVPGQAIIFGTMLLAQLGYSFFEEQAWGTWDRLRAAPVAIGTVIAAKASVNWVHQVLQTSLLVLVGGALLGIPSGGSPLAVVAVAASLASALVAIGFVAFSVSTSNAQFNIVCYLGALLAAGFGGALVPFDLLPSWARAVGPYTPCYWAMEGFERALAQGATVADVARPCGVLVAVAVVGSAVGVAAFRPDRRRRAYA